MCVSVCADDAETILLKAVLLQVICLYQKVVPHVVTQYNFDFSKLLKGGFQGLADKPPLFLPVQVEEVPVNQSRALEPRIGKAGGQLTACSSVSLRNCTCISTF